MTATRNLVECLPNDFGGQSTGPSQRVDHVLEPWEKRAEVAAARNGAAP
jgi:hypothetical protein